jgi:anti-sigma factor RsiW
MTDWTPLARGGAEEASEREARESRHQVLIELLGAYADRELPPETSSQIEAHLLGCARCRNELAVHQAVRLRLGVTPPVAAPPSLRERIATAIATTPLPATPAPVATATSLWLNRRVLLAAVAALMTVVVVVGIDLARRAP